MLYLTSVTYWRQKLNGKLSINVYNKINNVTIFDWIMGNQKREK